MATRKSKATPVAPQAAPPVDPARPMSAALTEILSLTAPVPEATPSSLSADGADPAIEGAQQNKNTVTLGLDPAFMRVAARAAKLNSVLKSAAAMFTTAQGALRARSEERRVGKGYRCRRSADD